MMQIALMGVAAGAASALLFLSVISASVLAAPLAYLAPLPILIITLGWGHLAGLVAMLSATLLLFSLFGGFLFLGFLIGTAFPAWWLGYLASLVSTSADTGTDETEWYPIGKLVIWSAVLAAAVVLIGAWAFGDDPDALRRQLTRAIEVFVQRRAQGGRPIPSDVDPKAMADLVLSLAPFAFAILLTCNNAIFLWLAARIVKLSGRLRRPWPDLPSMTFPPLAGVFAAAAVLVAMFPFFAARGTPVLGAVGALIPEPLGFAAKVLAVSLTTAHALLGLAALHALTRSLGGRRMILTAVYASIFVIGWPILLIALLGFAEGALDLRARVASRSPPPPTT